MMTIPRFLLLHSGTGWDEKGPRDIGYATSPQARAEVGYALHYKLPMLEDNETGEVVSQLPAIVLSLLVGRNMQADRVQLMRLASDAITIFAEFETAVLSQRAGVSGAWSQFKYRTLFTWMHVHNLWLHSRGPEINNEASLLSGLWLPLCDFLPSIVPIMEKSAPSLHSLVDQTGAHELYRPYRLSKLDPPKAFYADVFLDGAILKMDAEAGPKPPPSEPFMTPVWD